MLQMYDLAYGPPLEPPEGYYFLTNEQQADLAEEPEDIEDDE